MSLPECPAFGAWYRSIHERDPFPWQARLAKQVSETGEWPGLIGIPTGLGKTACLDIAVWALADQADREPRDRTVPTRIWWVVNRRILVDDTYRHALRLGALLDNPVSPRTISLDGRDLAITGLPREAASTVEAMAARLREVAGVGPPLQALRLRGGDSHNRPGHSAQPAIVCSTIPMFGSRVLFRGYGSSRSMRPIDAALAGTDSLVLLDEAHLAQPLRVLLDAVSEVGTFGTGAEHVLPTKRRTPVVVALTATGEDSSGRFDLDKSDYEHEEIRRRLGAAKPLSISEVSQRDTAKAVVSAAKELVDSLAGENSCGILVFVNTPKTALAVASAMRSRYDCQVVVATGRTRGVEAKKAIEAITNRMSAGRSTDRFDDLDGKHLIVIATQTLEVGADLDADYMITEACGIRSLAQRLGRLNRLGRRDHARGIYLHVEPKDIKWPVYGDEPVGVLKMLDAARDFDETVDMSPGNIGAVLGDLQPEESDSPVLAEALLWEWVKTSAPPPGEAPVEPFFSGSLEEGWDVEVVWRAHVPQIGHKIWPRISSEEVVSVSASEARRELGGSNCVRVGPDQASAEQIAVGDNGELVLRPGDTVVVASQTGKLDPDGHWDPAWENLAMDASILANGLVASNRMLEGLYDNVPDGPKSAMRSLVALIDSRASEPEPEEVSLAAHRLCDVLEGSAAPLPFAAEQWKQFVHRLRNGIVHRNPRHAVVRPAGEAPRLPVYFCYEQQGSDTHVSFDEYDELSTADAVGLEAHGDDTAVQAGRIARAVGFTSRIVEVVERSALIHDIGKADIRFQNWLDPNQSRSEVMAKSKLQRSQWERNRAASGWPRGGRHEELSRRLAHAWLAQGGHDLREVEQALLMHLVVAHHGRGRPLVPPVGDSTGTNVTYQIDGHNVTADADLSTVDWSQPARFASLNEIYGFWGLALLEAVVRQSDHLVSGAAQRAMEIR